MKKICTYIKHAFSEIGRLFAFCFFVVIAFIALLLVGLCEIWDDTMRQLKKWFPLLAFILSSMAFFSCKCINIPPQIVRVTETEKQGKNTIIRDSVYIHDSIIVTVKGDTVFKDRWHTEYVDKWRYDTAYVEIRDSVPVPYEVVVSEPYVPKFYKCSTWALWLVIGAIILYYLMRLILKKYIKR